jgi:general secretion pathway protein D
MKVASLSFLLLVWSTLTPGVSGQEAVLSLPGLPGLSPPPAVTKTSAVEEEDDNRAVRKSLEKRISVHFEDITFKDAMKQLAGQLEVTVLLDPEGMEEAGVTPDQLVALQLPPARARNVLKLLLEPLHLTIVVRNGVLMVTSEEKAGEMLETRVYNVRDLVEVNAKASVRSGAMFPVPEGMKVVFGGSRSGVEQDFDTLIDLITSTVQPDSWTDNGGSGSISGFPRGGLLVVSQTDDFHEELQQLLDMLRSAADKPGVTLPQR